MYSCIFDVFFMGEYVFDLLCGLFDLFCVVVEFIIFPTFFSTFFRFLSIFSIISSIYGLIVLIYIKLGLINWSTTRNWSYVPVLLFSFFIYTRQQKKCPVVQIFVTSQVFGRFLSIMYQIKQHIMWIHLISFLRLYICYQRFGELLKMNERNSE